MTTMQRGTVKAMCIFFGLSILCGDNGLGSALAALGLFCFLILAIGVVVDLFGEIFKR